MAILNDGDILYASEFNNKQDKFATVNGTGTNPALINISIDRYTDKNGNIVKPTSISETQIDLTNPFFRTKVKLGMGAIFGGSVFEGLQISPGGASKPTTITTSNASAGNKLIFKSGDTTPVDIILSGIGKGIAANDAVNVAQLNNKQIYTCDTTFMPAIDEDKTTLILQNFKYWNDDTKQFIEADYVTSTTNITLTQIMLGNPVLNEERITLKADSDGQKTWLNLLSYNNGSIQIKNIADGTETNDAVNVKQLNKKQNTLISGTNIKTINGESLLGSGDITISSGGSITIDTALSATSTNAVQNKIVNSALSTKQDLIKSTDILNIASLTTSGLRSGTNSMTLFNDNCIVSMTDDALIINFV